ncbi:MAG: PT domain-containing protein [Dehalococcoidia bacterium]
MRTGTVLLVGAALLLLAPLAGCNGETATSTPTLAPTSTPVGTPTPAPTDEATPVPTSTQLESGTVAVYYQASLGGGTSYHTVEGQTLVMKGSGGGVFRYLTEQDDVTMVEDYVSPSYARNELHPYTIDGRLFLVQIWEGSATAEFQEFDPTGSTRLAGTTRLGHNSDYLSWSGYALVGNRLFYQTARSHDPFAPSGYSGGQLMVRDLGSDARAKTLLSYDDPDNQGSLHAVGSNLYRIDFSEDYYLVQINRIDLTSGKVAKGLEFSIDLVIDNWRDYVDWAVAGDQDAFYIAAKDKIASAVNLWRLSWSDLEKGDVWNLALVHSQALEDERDGLLGLDADEGYVALELFTWGKGTFILYDHGTGTATTVKPGHDPRHVQIMKVR